MKKNNKYRKVIFLLVMLLAVTVGFALLSTTLKINGVTGIKSNTWDIHWKESSISVTNGSVNASTPTVNGTNNDTVNFSVNLELPGDFYEFTIDAENSGTIDGKISLAPSYQVYDENNTLLEGDDIPDYINFEVKYANNTTPAVGDVLKKTETKKYRVRIEIDSNAENLPTTNKTFTYKYKVEYEQYKASIPNINSSWQDIIDGYTSGKTEKLQEDMENGTTREVKLDLNLDGIYETTKHVRIANMTSCSKVSLTSKTACGLVLEFSDNIVDHVMNYSDINAGGWEQSEMRDYLNNKTSGTVSIYNALESDLRNKIINTNVVSGHSPSDSSNFETTDKIYLFSPQEVLGGSLTEMDTAWGSGITRELDYYSKVRETIVVNYAEAIKEDNGEAFSWWTRTPDSNRTNSFYYFDENGYWYGNVSSASLGVSPAFRLAE